MNFRENIRIAFQNVRSNLLRSVLTLTIIAFGIMALVGILTALDSVTASLSENFSLMGANSFNIIRAGDGIGKRTRKKGKVIDYAQAELFKDKFDYTGANVSISALGTSMATIKYDDKKSNPNVAVYGGDEAYLEISGYEIDKGRNFSSSDVQSGRNVAILGYDLLSLLFEKEAEALDAFISVGNVKYKVIGYLKKKGSSASMSGDRLVLVPLLNVKRYYGSATQNYNITVGVSNAIDMETAMNEATVLFRSVRKLPIKADSDFELQRSDGLISILTENTATIRFATIIIGLITLLGAAIGLMNIMLVSVTERTREIGICKAIGANNRSILLQFLTEAVVICQLGGLLGILLGILAGNGVSFLVGGSFIVPWTWMILGVVMCFLVGVLSGYYPAYKASQLDPIESLRYE